MRTLPIEPRKDARRLLTRALAVCLLAGLWAAAARPPLHVVLAQPSSSPAVSSQEVKESAPEAETQNRSVKPTVKRDAQDPRPTDPQPHRPAGDSANLLKLANALKADVDKTTADTFSASAIREVQEIEKLAHKMRTK